MDYRLCNSQFLLEKENQENPVIFPTQEEHGCHVPLKQAGNKVEFSSEQQSLIH